ncbi:sigma factor [Pseudomonas aeruginosa]|nr:sigma factor [Pseudomonas aeruginosa]
MENHYRELLRFLSARLGDRHAAADVAHDAYLRVLERSSQAQIEHPKAFLYRTALNLAVDEHRRSRVRRAEPLRSWTTRRAWPVPRRRRWSTRGSAWTTCSALAELPAICRSSFLLRKLDGLSHSADRRTSQYFRSLVEKHIVNAMKHCRVRMREWEAD